MKGLTGWELRPAQEEAVRRINVAFESGKKIVAVQGPTGSGKSLIGLETALAHPLSYYLVPLKALQDQIAKDFATKMNVFKGKSNYLCTQYTKYQTTVDKAPCQERSKESTAQRKECRENQLCNYYNALEQAQKGPHTLMNFTLFLCWMRIRNESPLLAPFLQRPLHIIDEAHNIEGFVRDFLSIQLSSESIRKYLAIESFPGIGSSDEQIKSFLVSLEKRNQVELEDLKKVYGTNLAAIASEINDNKLDFHLTLEGKLEMFLDDRDNYGFGHENRFNYQTKKHQDYILAKPLKVGGFIRDNLLGERTLLMSATLPQKAVSAMGFKDEEFEYIDLPSTFPAKNRLIKFASVGRINQTNSESLVPKMAIEVNKVLTRFPEVKGIIHSPSYRLAELLFNAVRSERLILQEREPGAAMRALKSHTESPHPTVLLTPGMKEGVDLKDDLSRFQIILKAPYPSLGDPAVKKLAKENHAWYITKTLVDFMQMYGRSIRSADDFAETIILDDNMRSLLVQYKTWVPKYIMEAVRWVG